MKHVALIYNPVSGNTNFKNRLDSVLGRFQQNGYLVMPFRSTSKEAMREFIYSLKNQDIDVLAVSGGDGTVHEVVNALIEYDMDIPLGIIPSGTSNDFATYLNISKNLLKCVDTICKGEYKYSDIGKVNDKYFLNVACAGLLTSVAHSVDSRFKNTLGKVAYYLKGLGELPNFRPLPMKINIDGVVMEKDLYMFLVMNSRTVASFPNLAPHAQIDDGKLDILIVDKCNVPELMTLFISLLKGDHINHKNSTYLQGEKISITCDIDMESDVDGEVGPMLPLTIEAVKGRIRVLC